MSENTHIPGVIREGAQAVQTLNMTGKKGPQAPRVGGVLTPTKGETPTPAG